MVVDEAVGEALKLCMARAMEASEAADAWGILGSSLSKLYPNPPRENERMSPEKGTRIRLV